MRRHWRHSLFSTLIATACAVQYAAAGPDLDKGIREYNAGHFNEALGLFGEAQSSDFNNPVLHYYMASTYFRMDQKENAIKEYKIALAMQPQGQLADYCQRALQTLGATSAPPGAKGGNDKKDAKQGKQPQRPQVIGNFCGCPLCRRVEVMFGELANKYGDRVEITRIMQGSYSNSDPLAKKYRPSDCPEVILVDAYGSISNRLKGLIPEAQLRKEVDELAASSPKTQFSSAADEKTASMRDAIAREAESKIADDQRLLNEEITRAKNDYQQRINDMPRRFYDHQYANQLNQEMQNRIESLRKDFEQKKRQRLSEAQYRIDSLSTRK